MHLDTVCTMVDIDAIVMYPNVADTSSAYAITAPSRTMSGAGRARGRASEPFLVAAAKAMGIDTLRADRHRARPGHRRARAVGRRQQHARDRTRGSRSPTSATSRPTPGWRRPASRWSRSPAPSWARAAAVRAVCPARSCGTRSDSGHCGAFAASREALPRSERESKSPAVTDGGYSNDRALSSVDHRSARHKSRCGISANRAKESCASRHCNAARRSAAGLTSGS